METQVKHFQKQPTKRRLGLLLEGDGASIGKWSLGGFTLGIVIVVLGLLSAWSDPDLNWAVVVSMAPLLATLSFTMQLAFCLSRAIIARVSGVYIYWILGTPGRYASDNYLQQNSLTSYGRKEHWGSIPSSKGWLLIVLDIALFILFWLLPWTLITLVIL